MIILDTDVLSHIQTGDPIGLRILENLDATVDRDVRITTITAYEMLRGAIKLIDEAKRDTRKQSSLILPFELLDNLVEYLSRWQDMILAFDVKAETVYKGFPPRLRQELKGDARIASIALTLDAVVWTCNVRDLAKVAGLRVVRAETGAEAS